MKETLGIFAFSCLSLLTASAFAAAPAWLDVAVSAESAKNAFLLCAGSLRWYKLV